MECALQHCPPKVDETQWKTLCAFFNSDDFKKRSAKNNENRSKQTIVYAGGSCGFARREYKLDQAKADVESLERDGVKVDEDQVFLNILGPKKCYIHGRGLGPRLSSSTFEASARESAEKELVVARKEVEEARKEAEVAKKEAVEANQKLTEMMSKHDELESRVSSKFKLLMDFIAQTHGSLPKGISLVD